MKINSKRIIITGVLFAILSQVVHIIEAFLTMNYYTNPAYFALWSKLMTPTAGAPGIEFYAYSLCFGVITGMLLAYVYQIIKGSVPGKTISKKGLSYGMMIFAVAGIPNTLALYLLFAIPSALLLYWAIFGLIIYLLSGMLIAKLN